MLSAALRAAGIHVVTPNKQAGSADIAFYRTLAEARRAGGSHFLYEATVGASERADSIALRAKSGRA